MLRSWNEPVRPFGSARPSAVASALLIATAFVFGSGGARAETEPDATTDGADATGYVQRGLALRREKRNEEALAAFRAAYAIAPSPRIRAQIGLAEQALAQWAPAEEDLTAALDAKDDPFVTRNRSALESAAARIASHLGSLTVEATPVSARIVVDDASPVALPLSRALRVPLGDRALRVEAPGCAPIVRTIYVDAGADVRLVVALEKITSEPVAAGVPKVEPEIHADRAPRSEASNAPIAPPPIAESDPARTRYTVAAATSFSLAVGAIAGGAYLGLGAIAARDARDRACGGVVCGSHAVELDQTARRDALGSTILFGLGAAATAGGAWLWWKRAHHAPVQFAPAVGKNGGTLQIMGVW